MVKHKRWLAGLLAGVAATLLCAVSAAAQNVTQGYVASQELQNGMIVRLDPKNPRQVQALPQSDATDMLGVTVANSAAPVSLSDPTQKQVYVATFGKYAVLVSSQNGPIKKGDYIAASAIDGVGMKAGTSQMIVLGKALDSFTGTSDAESTVQLTTSTGGKTQVTLRRIGVDIEVAHNPNYSGDSVAGVPHFLSRAAALVTKKPVTALRIYAGLGVLALALGLAAGIIYAGVRTGMTAVGRNPLAKKSILRNLITVTLMALIIVIIGLVAVYLLLKI